ncbi:type III polyketide synthase [Nonlabens ulvanivorans]|uniref:3-oxoacyl-ACP reductase n=1 Tax=Nonlabens ulvanivorans TaxID=906888 RepID=A0A084JWM1_NONUL|nr:3-oxoacyl-[acyl-carrier-protein] synthase III C-terminal domain-containing protein [Nonlabens ulvanivorans]KEZ93355.1 3-oxoacyl-ACP reductase [Nonlabens ulvanivorans]PRX13516.1 putative naringenin-chalcone synthase [Nonlabens ulvanivorans]
MSVKIKAVATQLPKYYKETKEILPFVETWLADQDDRLRRKTIKIFEGAGVDKRYSIMDPIEVFTKTSFEDRNAIYKREVVPLAEKAVQKALDKACWQATDLDYIISVSCTGIMIPSIDAYLINSMGMRPDIYRLPVTEMGCVAGVSGLIYAQQFLTANPGKKAAVLAIEAPTATFQLEDYSMANMVSAAIFGDGCACVLLSSHDDDGPVMKAHEMYHFPDATHMMGFDLVNSGLQMVLDKAVPETIASHFPAIIHPFLEKQGLSIEDIDHLIFHPGGKKIVQTVEELFAGLGKDINDTKEVLRLYGNMSSATVLFVLERFMTQNLQTGERGLMLSFGPGFTAQRILLEW